MQLVILAGGLGTRISEETHLKPKPMIEIGGKPIIWHIMKIYSHYGINDFIICCGYKGYLIKEYFSNYYLHNGDLIIDYQAQKKISVKNDIEPWKISLIDTGEGADTAERLLKVKKYIKEEKFCFTYGDGVADINIKSLIDFHINSKSIATLTAVQPPGRFGALCLNDNIVTQFQEKTDGVNSWINGGFFVLDKKIFDYFDKNSKSWEEDLLPKISEIGYLNAYKHFGFWQPMDTLRDKNKLEDLISSNNAPWKVW